MKSQVNNSEISHYYALLSALYSDVARAYPARIQTECRRDLKTIRSRLLTEGISFLTKTLPALGKALDKALSDDSILQVHSFAKKKGSQVPQFMGWLIGTIFGSDGVALPATDAACLALRHARQLCLSLYKLELPIDPRDVDKTMSTFKQTDRELETACDLDVQQRHALRVARKLIKRVLCNADPRKIIPRHGPGAVATHEKPWEKIVFKRFYPDLHACYDYSDHFYFNYSHLCDELGDGGLATLEYVLEPPTAKVVLVPKDSRGPRLISMEPLEIQWIQQGLKDVLVDTLESHPLTAKHINFADQECNRRLALESSVTGRLVTLDMKDASDRVSLKLVQWLFPENWVECLMSCRSTATELPDGEIVQLEKFAPMGSALCFPVEALCFWALSCASLITYYNLTERQAAARVWVYGDDIILHREDYPVSMQLQEAVGLRFNSQKCCTGTHFRESCGLDAYNGFVVTPIRFKRRWSSSLPVQTHASWVDYRNRLAESGYTAAAEFLEKEIQQCRRTPYLNGELAGICFAARHQDARVLNKRLGVKMRFNPHLQTMQVRCTFARSAKRIGTHGWKELLAHSTRTRFVAHRDDVVPSFRKGLRMDNRVIDNSLRISTRVDAGHYSVPHRVISQWGWAHLG